MERLARDGRLRKLLEHTDGDLARKCREGRCKRCGGRLHSAKYERKPRPNGFEDWNWRHSFCCEKEGCRKRHTPPSVRFLGRREYVAVVVVLMGAMVHGLKPHRVERLRQVLQVDEKTLKGWQHWWQETFVQSDFWKGARSRFKTRPDETIMPLSLVEAFGAKRPEGMLKLLEFLSPITEPGKGVIAM